MGTDGSSRRCRTALSLPEDVLLEILVRVEDPATLFRCAVACSSWSRLVADGSFLRRRWPDQHTSACTRTPSTFVAGFFVRNRLANPAVNKYCNDTFFVPTPRSVLGPGLLLLGSFFPEAAAGLLDDVVPLASRRGLLLIRLNPRGADPATIHRLAVCNMLTGVCDVLPPLDFNWNSARTGYTIITGADYYSDSEQHPSAPPGYLAFFKVFIIDNHNINQPLSIHTFSSQDARWSTPIKCPSNAIMKEGDRVMLTRPEAVVCKGGTTHWLLHYTGRENTLYTCTLDVDTKTCCASLMRIDIPNKYLYSPLSYDLPRLSVINGRTLSLFFQHNRGMRVVIWTRKNDGKSEVSSKWVHDRVIELKPPVEAEVRFLVMLDEKDGNLLVDDKKTNVYIVNLKTGSMEKITYWPDGWHSRQRAVLLEIDWPAFFASRLGSL